MSQEYVTPRIYVASLSDYTSHVIYGKWIDANQDTSDILAEIEEMLAGSLMPDAEEWAIHDYEGFGKIELGEYEDIKKISEIGKMLAEHGTAYAAYAYEVGVKYATPEDFEERYQGCWESEEDFAYHLWDDMGHIKELEKLNISESYIDWGSVARDMFIDSYSSVKEGYEECYVFARY